MLASSGAVVTVHTLGRYMRTLPISVRILVISLFIYGPGVEPTPLLLLPLLAYCTSPG
jgi:hypothetical protein